MKVFVFLFCCLGIYAFVDQVVEGINNPHIWHVDTGKSLFGTISPPAEEYYLFLDRISPDMLNKAHYSLILAKDLTDRYQSYTYESIYYLPGRYIHPQRYFETRNKVKYKEIDYVITFKCFPKIEGTKVLYRDDKGLLLQVTK